MKYNQEHIYMLLLQKQLGEISESEDLLLQEVMVHDDSVRKCWQELEEAKHYTDNDFLDDLRIQRDWYQVEALLQPRPVHRRVLVFFKKYQAVAAILLAAVAMAGGYRLLQQTALPPKIAARSPQQPATAATRHQAPVPQPAVPQAMPVITAGADSVAIIATTATTDTARHTVLVKGATPQPDSAGQLPGMIRRVENDAIYQSSAIEWNTLTVPPQTDYRLELSDGTEVHLNASSTLRFPFIFPGRTREVYLEGEAYFTVAHNPKQPFIVHTGNASVIALGTAFNVNSYNTNLITTSLVQGSVITDVGDSLDVTLKPGYQAIYRPGEKFQVKRFDETVTLAWRDGLYRFRNNQLEDLAPVMMRWFGLKLEFARPSLANKLFSGQLEKDKPVAEFLDSLCKQLDISYQIYDGTVHFSAGKK